MADIERLRFKTFEDQNDQSIIHGEYLKKKIKKKTWKDFWVIIKDNMMIFFHSNDGGWAGSIELTLGSSCTLIVNGTYVGKGLSTDLTLSAEVVELNKKRKHIVSYKFALKTKNGVHLFKASSEAICLEWIRVLRKVVLRLYDDSALLSSTLQNASSGERKGQKNNNKKSFMYETFETEDSEHEVHGERKLTRSKSLRESRSPFSRSRFYSFRGLKTFRRYNSLQE